MTQAPCPDTMGRAADPSVSMGSNLSPAVAVRDLVKTPPRPESGTFNAVDGVSFEVCRGQIFGFLGPDGAGKTTTLEIIEGLTEPTSGRAGVLGLDSQRDRTAVKDRIGGQLQAAAYFDFLTLEEILDLFGSFYTPWPSGPQRERRLARLVRPLGSRCVSTGPGALLDEPVDPDSAEPLGETFVGPAALVHQPVPQHAVGH